MKKKLGKIVPIVDCPNCGAKDTPLSFKAQMVKGEKVIEIWECPECGTVPNFGSDLEVKRWVDIQELKEAGDL